MVETGDAVDRLIQMSLDFIQNNPDAYSDEIPTYLLEFWMNNKEPGDEDSRKNINEEEDPEWTVFLFAYLNYKKNQGAIEVQVTIEELKDKFSSWQCLLRSADISSAPEIKMKPFPVFRFDEAKELQIEFINDDELQKSAIN